MMKTVHRLLIAVALLGTGSLALAAPAHGKHDRDSHGHHDRGHDDRHHGDQNRQARYDHHRHDNRHYDNRHYNYSHHSNYYAHRGHQRWVRGHRYYGPTYVVRNYGYYRLRPPPYGYNWVRADDGYFLLVAATTGLILDLAMN